MPQTLLTFGLIGLLVGAVGAQTVNLSVDPSKINGRVDPLVYGQFLEHIYHSANGGLWGDLVWNRSFEEAPGAGAWVAAADELAQTELASDVRLVFGDPAWTDYEYTLQARRDGGAEGFLIPVRYASDQEFYWLNLGGWQNDHHGLERSVRTPGGVRRTTVATAPGKIELGRWYTIRARLEGPRLRFWLDGEPLLDYTDDGAGPTHGQVGLGTWNTSARFRNLKVTDLAGKTLFEGLPAAGAQRLPRHWAAYGPGQAVSESGHAANSSRNVRLLGSAEGETGLRQVHFPLRRGWTYVGSLFYRGEAPGGLVVRLRSGDKIASQERLPAPSAEWTEAKLSLRSGLTDLEGTLEVALLGAGDVALDQVSLMPRQWAERDGLRPDLVDAVAGLRPPVIRWPGGAYAERYRWLDGIGPQAKRGRFPISIWDDVDTNSLGTDEFIQLCRRVGAEPMLVVNIGRHDRRLPAEAYLREALDWMEYCNGGTETRFGALRAANGHPEPYHVKFWEIDNESWIDGTAVADYITRVKLFAPAMRAAWPGIKLAATGSGGLGEGRIGLEWNRAMVADCADLLDYLSIHHYEDPNRFGPGPGDFGRFIDRTAEMIAGSANPNLKLFVSEWNAQSTDWRTGLYCGGLLNTFESRPAVGMAAPALFLRHTSADAWDNAFINFDQTGWFPGPNYVVMKLYWDNFEPQRLTLDGQSAPLITQATSSQDGQTMVIKAVNPSDSAVSLKLLVEGGAKSAIAQVVAPDSLEARNTLAAPSAIGPKPLAVQLVSPHLSVELPRWSVAVVRIKR